FSDNPDGPTTPIGDDPAFALKPPCPQSITRVIENTKSNARANANARVSQEHCDRSGMPVLAFAAMKRRELLKAGAATLALSNAACGYILYPERKGQTGGRIDVGVLIIDLVWLLPGLLPGIVCLAVDFTTGCIYYGGG